MASSAVEQVVKSELRHYPGVELELKDGGKHDRAVFHFGDHSRFLTLPKTPSDWRASRNIVRDLRKTLEELGVPRKKDSRGGTDQKRWHYDATVALQSHALVFSIPKHSPLNERFTTADPREVWSVELQASPDLKAPPILALKRSTLPPGTVRARMGSVRPLKTRNGGVILKMSRTTLPTLLQRAPNIRAAELKLKDKTQDALMFKVPEGVIPTSYTPHEDEAPLPSQAFVPKAREPEPEHPPAPAPVAAPAPAPAFPTSLKLEFPKSETFTIERAIRYLNQQKLKLGGKLRFTINEGGSLSAVHRIE